MSNQGEYFDYEIDGVEAYSTALSEASFEVSQLEIAINHGFWHFGRFAEQYLEMFGESPSETKSSYLLGQAD